MVCTYVIRPGPTWSDSQGMMEELDIIITTIPKRIASIQIILTAQLSAAQAVIWHPTAMWNTVKILAVVNWVPVRTMLATSIITAFHKVFHTVFPHDNFIKITEK